MKNREKNKCKVFLISLHHNMLGKHFFTKFCLKNFVTEMPNWDKIDLR